MKQLTILFLLITPANYNDAIKIFDSIQDKNQQDYFIAAQSYLQLNNPTAAINAFKAD